MGRKSKHAGGNMPLTHYERTHKFVSSEYGTTRQRFAGHAQYQVGECALTTQRLVALPHYPPPQDADVASNPTPNNSVALCSPSGYLYAESAILEYLLHQTLELKRQQQQEDEQQQHEMTAAQTATIELHQKRLAQFRATQSGGVTKKIKVTDDDGNDDNDNLKRVSYWLASSQPIATRNRNSVKPTTPHNSGGGETLQSTDDAVTLSISTVMVVPTTTMMTKKAVSRDETTTDHETATEASTALATTTTALPSSNHSTGTAVQTRRPVSPMTGSILRRKDLWPIQLEWDQNSVRCAVTKRTIQTGAAVVAYWTTKPKSKQRHNNDTNIHLSPADANTNSSVGGRLILQTVYDELSLASTRRCPVTDEPIRATRVLQKSGSSFAASGQAVSAAQYRPTIT